MKIILLNYVLLLIVLSFSITIYGQDRPAPKQDTLSTPLNETAFNKSIMQDINFMVLGNNNPKQGFAYEYDEKRTELSISGALQSTKSYIATIDGSFSVDDGVFIFDNKDGSKRGNVSLNLFVPAWFGNGKSFPAVKGNKDSSKTNRARYINYKIERELPEKVLDTFRTLDAIMKVLGLPRSGIDKTKDNRWLEGRIATQRNLVLNKKLFDTLHLKEVDKITLYKVLLKYYKNPDPKVTNYDSLVDKLRKDQQSKMLTLDGTINSIKENDTLYYNIPKSLDIDKLYKDYDKIVERATNIDKEISDTQIKNFKDLWILEYNTYFGFSTYYERESLETYNDDALITEFSKRFTETKGDLYGAKLSFNNVVRHKNGVFMMFRILATFGRASNFKDFEKKEYVYTSLPVPIGSGVIVEEQKKTGYYTENAVPYSYGFLQKYSTELYISSKAVGIYGKFGYSKNKALVNKETLPFETGVMINVQSDKKSVVSILLFVSRDDLKEHPDEDTNFGFKIGLPINIKKRDKESENKSK